MYLHLIYGKIFELNIGISMKGMRGSKKFCQSGVQLSQEIFLVDEGREDPNITKSGPFEWRFAGGPMMAQH